MQNYEKVTTKRWATVWQAKSSIYSKTDKRKKYIFPELASDLNSLIALYKQYNNIDLNKLLRSTCDCLEIQGMILRG